MEQIISVALSVLITIITAIIGIIGKKVVAYINSKDISAEKKAAANTAVRAVEQIYKDIHGDEKLNKAKNYALELLSEKGISISETELDLLIHEVVQVLNENKIEILEAIESE